MGYSKALKLSAIKYYEAGFHTQKEVSDILGIHISTFKRIYKRYRETGSVDLPKNNAGRPNLIDADGLKRIKSYVLSNPTILLEEIQRQYDEDTQVSLSIATICRALQSLSLNRKKISRYAQEQERPDVKKKKSLSEEKCEN